MKYRILGKTDLKVSEVSLGTWQLGGKWGQDYSEKTAEEILDKALEKGINFIDTADVYNGGKSELSIGKFLKKVSSRIYVATKCGRKLSPHTAEGYNKKNITGFVEDSLKRLDIEALDLIQLHCPPTEVYCREEAFQALEDLKMKGKILHYGVSVEKIEEALQAVKQPGVASVQIIYNIFRQRPAQEFFETADRENVGIIVRVPLASGLLTGKLGPDSKFSEGDHRNFNREGQAFDKGETFSGVPYDVGLEAAKELKKIFASENIARFALKWVLEDEFVSCVIPGASNTKQVEENAEVSGMCGLTQDQMQRTKEVYDTYIREHVHSQW